MTLTSEHSELLFRGMTAMRRALQHLWGFTTRYRQD